jgi:hypothetical protein
MVLVVHRATGRPHLTGSMRVISDLRSVVYVIDPSRVRCVGVGGRLLDFTPGRRYILALSRFRSLAASVVTHTRRYRLTRRHSGMARTLTVAPAMASNLQAHLETCTTSLAASRAPLGAAHRAKHTTNEFGALCGILSHHCGKAQSPGYSAFVLTDLQPPDSLNWVHLAKYGWALCSATASESLYVS